MSLTLFTNPQSRGKIAEWMLAEVGVPYRKIELAYGAQMKDYEYLARNPMGKVPTLVHNNMVVTEAAAICLYLADAFPDAKLSPTSHERANYYRWILFAAGPLEQGLSIRSLNIELDQEQKGQFGCGDVDTAIEALAKHLAKKDNSYVAGNRFTAADVYVGSQLHFYVRMFKMIPTCDAFEKYLDRVKARPAWVL